MFIVMHDAEPSGAAPSPLRLTVSREAGVAVLRIDGEVDMASVGTLRVMLNRLVPDCDVGVILLDVTGLRFIDAQGIRVIVDAWDTAAAHGRLLRMRGLHGAPARVFRFLGLDCLADDPRYGP